MPSQKVSTYSERGSKPPELFAESFHGNMRTLLYCSYGSCRSDENVRPYDDGRFTGMST